MFSLLCFVPLFPLIGFLLLILKGEKLARPTVAWVGSGSIGLSFMLTAMIASIYLSGDQQAYRMELGSWFKLDDLSVPFGLYLDTLSLTMLFVVTGVGFLILVYSAAFMEADSSYARFFAYMNLFVFAMLVLVLADNLVLLYLGWEGVGLCSYLLIGFWHENPDNGYAARKAFVVTRVGDTCMMLGLLLLFTQSHTLDIQALMLKVTAQWQTGAFLPVAAAALLLGGAVGKSAQLPLQTWLPDAMAGPTPVSALIHAATMVTAGVYLIARTHELFMLAPSVQFAIALIGTFTLLMAGCSALVQTDIKRILAYSTISQIAYMFLALGVGAWSSAVFHLMTHAFFKALLFLAAGAVMFCYHDEHNIFKMRGLRKTMPLAFWSFLIGSAALAGLPFTSGYYSKHQILLAVFDVSPGLWIAACLGALITGVYSFRLVFIVFFGPENTEVEKSIDLRMGAPLVLLCLLALAGAFLQIPLDSVFPVEKELHHGFDLVSIITLTVPFLGLIIAVIFYLGEKSPVLQNEWLKPLQRFWLKGWGFDWLYELLLLRPFKLIADLNKTDIVDSIYRAIAMLSRYFHHIASQSQTGRVRWYAASMSFGLVLIIAIGLLS